MPLTLFGGLYTEANPESLPDGGSPLTINCDYDLGKVYQRPGKESAFVYNTFYLLNPSFTQSIGPGVPWSAGSVSLNEPAPSTPAITSAAIGRGTPIGSVWPLTYLGLTQTGPCVFVWPIIVQGFSPPGGDSAWVTGISDDAGGIWSVLTAHTSWTYSEPPPFDPSTFSTYQVWVGLFPVGIPTGMNINMTLNVDINSGVSSFEQTAGAILTGCDAVHQYAFLKIDPTVSPIVNGAQITTTQECVILAISTITAALSVPTHTLSYHNSGGTPGIIGTYYLGSSIFLVEDPGTFNPTWDYGTLPGPPNPDTLMSTVALLVAGGSASGPISQTLQSTNFTPPIPPNTASPPLTAAACGCGCSTSGQLPVFGLEVLITGSQTDISPDAVITVQLQLPDGTLSPETFKIQLPLSTGTVVVGSPTDMWGLALSAALINDPNFTVNLVASTTNGETVTFTASVQLKVFTTPNPPPDINYLKTFAQTDGDLFSLALGSDGVIYQEDVINNEGMFSAVYTAIEPESFAESCTVDDREFIALSNLLNGTDIPYTYDGTNFDRLSQVGPGAPPTASTSTTTINIVSITQPPVMSDVDNPGHLEGLLWSNGPGSTAPGNVLTVYYSRISSLPVADPNLQPGVGVTIAGVDVPGPNQDFNGQSVDGNYTVVSVGQGVPPGAQFGRWYFTVTMPSTQSVNQANHISAHAPFGTYQVTTATLTTAQQVPNAEVGSTIQIAGTGGAPAAGYDGSWQITTTPNASQLQITSTALTGNVATYGFNLVTGTNPAVGERVTISGTLNGNGIFNLVQGVISSTSPGIFSILLTGPDTPSAAETGTGIIFGTIFTFEPGQPVGTRAGGTVVTQGIISAGVRKVCYSFLTRNGYMTAPSPILTFDVTSGASVLTIGNLASGPSDVIARVVHLTAANGGNFYNIPIPVTVLSNGVNVVNSSTYVNDNTSRSVNLTFSDGVLLAANAIDIQGNNLFATLELGSVLGLIGYASRVFAIGEQNKVPNFLNWSFDGGYLDASLPSQPLGWTVAAAGGSLISSPIFGFAYQIQGGSGMITQPAFQDEFMVPIIRASTKYSVRITAMVASLVGSGNLVVDLFSPSIGTALGTFSVPLASLATRMNIFTGTMLTAPLAPVPNDLELRLYVTGIGGATVLIDRVEPFPTEQPNLSTQVTGSYVNNFEAFDESGNGGIVDTAGENQQAVRSAFTLYDTLYLVKTGSFVSTQDNGSTEPSGWSLRIVSNSVGTPSIYGVTTGIDEPNTGEAWAIIAGQPGGYIFNGGEPIKITEEIQSLWNYINWAYGHTLWVKNDVKNRRIYFAVPLKTPNPWLPTGIIPDDSNPTTPNVILMLNYKQLNTGSTLAEKVGVHVSYSGRLIASELTRKWSIWTIKAPCAAFLERADTTEPLFLGNSDDNGKIFQLDEAHTMCGQDDCSAMIQIYDTYGFVTDEQGQGLRLGSTRKLYAYMMMMVRGSGEFNLRVFPNTLDSQYAHDLLPRIPLPLMTDGDIEIPLNETANRLFVQFRTDEIGSCFELSRLMMAMGIDPWSPVRGING